jgi:hypothetical protein
MLQQYNKLFVPFGEQKNLGLRQVRRVLSFARRGLGDFINNQFSNPVCRSA